MLDTKTDNENTSQALPTANKIEQPIVFTGSGTEYAKIFFVNLALTILTLGIYSAWAKVRNKRYFYGNTLLAQSSFDYHASPMQILKGRLLVVGLFFLYNILIAFAPAFGIVFILIFLGALPWLILKSTQFNMRNSSYRQIRFDFKGDVGEMFGLYVIFPILAAFTLWLAYPYVVYKQKSYYVNHLRFGQSAFSFNGKVKEFFFTYYQALLGIILFFILIGFLFGSQTRDFFKGFNESMVQQSQQEQTQTMQPEMQPIEIHIPSQIPESAPEQTQQQTPPQTQQHIPPIKEKPDPEAVKAVMIGVVLIYGSMILIMLVVMTYINTRITNYIFNNSKLDFMRFNSRINFWKLMWIYLSNTVLILLTLGIFIPWAKVRATRYKLTCITVFALDMDSYIAAESERVRAVGEELSDFLDVDVGF
jgi:uncharacterized membrane protein YjgN (DUF898 family)